MARVASARVAKPTNRPKPGKAFRLHVLLSPDLVDAVDRFRVELARQEVTPHKTRTEAVTVLLVEGLKKRGLLIK
jgi:hypothetical protein